MSPITHLFILGVSAVIFTVLKRFFSQKGLLDLPPGPKGWPLIGNLLNLCPDGHHPGKFYQKHKSIYGKVDCLLIDLCSIFLTNLTGPLSRLTVFGQPLIIVNDRETAAQLFEKSAKHSSKPDSVFADELYERL